jgi:hypothetical protein
LEPLEASRLQGGHGTVPFPTPRGAEKYYQRILDMDLVISAFSTINYEAKMLGVPTVFLGTDPSIGWMSRRDHLQLLSERHGIPVVTDASQVMSYLR